MTSRNSIRRRLNDLEGNSGTDAPSITIRHVGVDADGEPEGVISTLRAGSDARGEWQSERAQHDPPEPLADHGIDADGVEL